MTACQLRSRPAAIAIAIAATGLLLGCGGEEPTTPAEPSDPPALETGLSVSVEPATAAPGSKLKARIVNETAQEFTYGGAYELERETSNGFAPVELPNLAVPSVGYVAPPGEAGPPVVITVPENAEAGSWRVVLARDVPRVGELSAEFGVEDG